MTDFADCRVIQCNIARPTKTALAGARCYVYLINPGMGSERIQVLIYSRGKRWILKWENIKNLENFRAKTLPPEHPRYADNRIMDFGDRTDRTVAELETARVRMAGTSTL